MLEREDAAASYKAYLSTWKTGGLTILFLAMAILPITPHFGDGLFFTAIFYHPPLSILRVISSIGCGFFAIIMVKFFIMALLGRAVLKIEADVIYVFGITYREFLTTKITSLIRQQSGNILIKISDQKSVSIPLFMLRDPERVWQYLRSTSTFK